MIFLTLFYVFFMIGLFTIGGGYAMIPMIEDQVVARGWLTEEELLNFFAIAESTPGPFAVNTATLVGFRLGNASFGLVGGLFGATITTLAVILPSFIIILVIAKYIQNFLKYKKVNFALNGIKAIIVGLLFSVVFGLVLANVFGNEYSFEKFDYLSLGIIVIIYITKRFFKKVSPIVLILVSGALGILFYGIIPFLLTSL